MTEPKHRKRKQPLGQSIGGVLFGFEQQIFRNQPPPHELVHHARPDDPVPTGDGGFLTIDLPDDADPGPAAGLTPDLADPGPAAGRTPDLADPLVAATDLAPNSAED
jgi:hypothetical protein